MPRKRTSESRKTPPISPTTSTPHTQVDQHHHLRHTGSSISTRTRVNPAPSKPPLVAVQPESTNEIPSIPKDQCEKRQFAEVSPPKRRTSLTKFTYAFLFLALLLVGWYIYGILTLLEGLKEEAAWWSIVGDPGAETWNRWGSFSSDHDWEVGKRGSNLEGSVNALADALGISPLEVVSAVKPLVPQSSLTSIASKAQGTGRSEVLRVLVEDTTRKEA